MRESVKDRGRLEHMLEMAEMLTKEAPKYDLDLLRRDPIMFYGLSKMVEIIGEAAYMITTEFKEANPELPWRQIVGMRHILVHGYYTISPEVLWDVINGDIPPMVPVLRRYVGKG